MCSNSFLSLVIIAISISKSTVGDILVYYPIIDNIYPQDAFKDVSANFGPGLPAGGLRGQVVYANPPDACSKIAEPPKRAGGGGDTLKWIVLIQRYNCSFEEKIRVAQNASYDAVIIHNVNSSELVPMSAKNPFGIVIPSVFVSAEAGLTIKTSYQYETECILIIDADQPFNINTQLLVPFGIVVGICFVIMIAFMIVKFVKDQMRQRRHRLPGSSLKKIPICKFSKGDPYETCAICLEDYIEGEKLRVLPCAHAYHSKCIDPWLTKNRRVCPVCKRKVFAHDEQPIPDSDSDSDDDDTSPLITPGNRNSHGTFARQLENPFQRATRSVSQIATETDQGQQNEGMFVTASGDHSINTETHEDAPSNSSSYYSSDNDIVSAREVVVVVPTQQQQPIDKTRDLFI